MYVSIYIAKPPLYTVIDLQLSKTLRHSLTHRAKPGHNSRPKTIFLSFLPFLRFHNSGPKMP